MRTLARPFEMCAPLSTSSSVFGSNDGHGPVGVDVGEVAVPDLLGEGDRGLRAHLLVLHLARVLRRLLLGGAQDERRGRQDLEVLVATPELRQAPLHVGVELLARLQLRMAGEDRVGARRGELAPLLGVARLDDHRVALRAARGREPPRDVELVGVHLEPAGVAVAQVPPGRRVGEHLVDVPGVPQRLRGLEELLCAQVALVLRQVAAAAEVLAGELVPAGHDVPRGAAAGEVVERGELAGDIERLVERGVHRAGEADPLGDRGHRHEDRDVVGAPDDVEVVDPAALLAQAQTLGEEEEVELRALRGLREVPEGLELDVAAGRRVAPDRRVVDAGEVGGEVDLLGHGVLLRPWRSGRRGARDRGVPAGCRPRRRCGAGRGAAARARARG